MLVATAFAEEAYAPVFINGCSPDTFASPSDSVPTLIAAYAGAWSASAQRARRLMPASRLLRVHSMR